MSDPSGSPMPEIAPVPRDAASSLMSEVLPLRSKRTNFMRSRLMVPAIATVATTMLLFGAGSSSLSDFWTYAFVLGTYIVFMLFFAMHAYGGSRKPIWVFLVPAAFTAMALATPLGFVTFYPIAVLFRDVLPGGEVAPDASFGAHFVSNFFGAGLAEELLKALPVLAMAAITLQKRRRPAGSPPRFIDRFALETPLDGLLAGAASGAGFILVETFGQYYAKQFASVTGATANEFAGVALALQLAIPRSLQGLVGHMAWNGIFGYFIALALRRPGLAIPLLLGGWLVPSAMHGFWNAGAVAIGQPALWISGMTTIVLFMATLLKAKQLEQGQTAFAPTVSTPSPASPAVAAAIPAPGPTHAPATMATASFQGIADRRPRLVLRAGASDIAVISGVGVDAASAVEIARLAPGFRAEFATHPERPDITGLRNLGAAPWTLYSPSGVSQTVAAGRSARLEPGARIAAGDLVLTVSTRD